MLGLLYCLQASQSLQEVPVINKTLNLLFLNLYFGKWWELWNRERLVSLISLKNLCIFSITSTKPRNGMVWYGMQDLSKYTVPKSFVGITVPTKVVGMLVVSAFLQRFWECRLFSRETKHKNKRSLTFILFIDQLTSWSTCQNNSLGRSNFNKSCATHSIKDPPDHSLLYQWGDPSKYQ